MGKILANASNESKLAMKWACRPLGKIAGITMGNSPPGESYNEDGNGIPLVNGPVEFTNGPFGKTKKIKFTTAPTKMCKEGDFLICVRGSTTGRTNIAAFDACIGRGVASIRAKLCQPYLNHFVRTLEKRIHASGKGSTFPSISRQQLAELPVPLPYPDDPQRSTKEQKRIADVLDKANGIRRKRREAISNLLTIPGSAFHVMFGTPSHNTKGWEIGTIRDLVEDVKYGSSSKASAVGEFPMLRMNNITYEGTWDLSSLKYIDLCKKDQQKYLAQKGDILFNRTNSRELVGKTAVFQEETPMAFAGYLVRARTNELAHPDYIAGYLNSPHGKATLRHMCKSIVGMANINAQEFQNIAIQHPPILAQEEYVELLDSVRSAEKPLRRALAEAETLFNSLVQRAFKGEL